MNAAAMDHTKREAEMLTKHEFGDLSDNNSAFLLIGKTIAAGLIREALDQLCQLRDHIKEHNDIKSRVHLLGRVEAQILSLNAQGYAQG